MRAENKLRLEILTIGELRRSSLALDKVGGGGAAAVGGGAV